MSITVNTNMSSLICQRSLTKATSGMNTALQRMSTGLKINSAKDDAAGCAISSKMDYKLSSYGVAQDNAQMGQSMLDTASGSLSVMNGMLQRMRDLSEQAANGTYGKEERAAMQAEVDALTKELYRIKNTTDFNGKKVLGTEEQDELTSVPDISMSEIDVNNIAAYKNKVIGISSAQELEKLSDIVNGNITKGIAAQGTTNVTFALTCDIDLDDLGLDANGSNWTAVGSSYSDSFNGTFDGNGYTIKNLKINTTKTTFTTADKYQGLFGYAISSTIKNVNLENVDVKGNSYVGGLVGMNHAKATITNCSTSGNVTGNLQTGGLVGSNNLNTKITNCSSSVTVTGNGETGGLVGSNGSATITNCSASGNVTGTNYTGGLVGINGSATITNCSASGNVTGINTIGGIVGLNCNSDNTYTTKSVIENCWCSDSVTGTTNVGGFVGINRASDITNSFTLSKVISNDSTKGAFIGEYRTGTTGGDGLIQNNQYNSNINPSMAPVGTGLTPNPDGSQIKDNTGLTKPTPAVNKVNLQVGINSDENSVISVATGFEMGDFKISLNTEGGARIALDKIDKMMAKVNAKQLDIGATSNRLASTMEFQEVQMSALTSANSLIKDADIAKESASYIKNQILQQTTATLLATANQNPSIALSLV